MLLKILYDILQPWLNNPACNFSKKMTNLHLVIEDTLMNICFPISLHLISYLLVKQGFFESIVNCKTYFASLQSLIQLALFATLTSSQGWTESRKKCLLVNQEKLTDQCALEARRRSINFFLGLKRMWNSWKFGGVVGGLRHSLKMKCIIVSGVSP